MKTALTRLSAACAGTLLLACAELGYRGPQPAPLAASPARADDAYVIGRHMHMARRYAPATASYLAALETDPGHVNARNGLATLYAEQGEFAKAIALWEALTAGAAAGPETAFLFSNLGYAHFLSGAYDKALVALEKACLLDPLNHRAWRHLGSALDKLGQAERAQHMYRQAAALEAHDFKADYALAPRSAVAAIDSAVRAGARPARQWVETDIRQNASGMYELRRVAPPSAARTAAPAAEAVPAMPVPTAMLEIRNGNGVTGMARSLARSMAGQPEGDGVRVVRLTNQKGFKVMTTRIEYQPSFRAAAERLAERYGPARVVEVDNIGRADMRLVIGRDLVRSKLAAQPAPRGGKAS